MHISHFLTNSTMKYPEKTALKSQEVRLAYKELNERVNRLASAMTRYGLKKCDRVAAMFYNTHHFVEVYFASLKLGAALTPVNTRFVGDEIEYIVNNSESVFFFFGREFHETISDIQDKLKTVSHFIGVNAGEQHFALDYEAFLCSGDDSEPEVQVNDDVCQIMYTSGTTGKPKGAMITHGNIFWNCMNTISCREHRPGEISLIIGPLFHTAGLNNHLTAQIALGGTSILIKKFEPELVLHHIAEDKANVISGSPAMFNLLLQHSQLDQFDTRSITKCTSGSAILPKKIKERLMDVFPRAQGVYDLYGCTEASPTIAALKAEDSFRKHGSVGPAAPFLHAMVVDEEDRPLPSNQVGELVCRGPNIMKGYYKDPLGTRETIRNNWLHTGDLAYADDEGYFYIVDRKKDMIVSGGENIYPREIEEVLFRHPAIADAAVVGIPHSVWGETVRAFVVPKAGQEINEAGVIEFCKGNLASYKKPTSVRFIDTIPRNAAGKVLKRLLKEPDV